MWAYEFVAGPKKQYSRAFRLQTVEQVLFYSGTSASIHETPVSTVQRMHQKALVAESERLAEQAWREAKKMEYLVLGIDDFAIKKGHTYNTGFHNMRGDTMLDLLAGRKLETFARTPLSVLSFCLFVPTRGHGF